MIWRLFIGIAEKVFIKLYNKSKGCCVMNENKILNELLSSIAREENIDKLRLYTQTLAILLYRAESQIKDLKEK